MVDFQHLTNTGNILGESLFEEILVAPKDTCSNSSELTDFSNFRVRPRLENDCDSFYPHCCRPSAFSWVSMLPGSSLLQEGRAGDEWRLMSLVC